MRAPENVVAFVLAAVFVVVAFLWDPPSRTQWDGVLAGLLFALYSGLAIYSAGRDS